MTLCFHLYRQWHALGDRQFGVALPSYDVELIKSPVDSFGQKQSSIINALGGEVY
jgi:hypothetical protein